MMYFASFPPVNEPLSQHEDVCPERPEVRTPHRPEQPGRHDSHLVASECSCPRNSQGLTEGEVCNRGERHNHFDDSHRPVSPDQMRVVTTTLSPRWGGRSSFDMQHVLAGGL
jgi:hypothetical protein